MADTLVSSPVKWLPPDAGIASPIRYSKYIAISTSWNEAVLHPLRVLVVNFLTYSITKSLFTPAKLSNNTFNCFLNSWNVASSSPSCSKRYDSSYFILCTTVSRRECAYPSCSSVCITFPFSIWIYSLANSRTAADTSS